MVIPPQTTDKVNVGGLKLCESKASLTSSLLTITYYFPKIRARLHF